MTAPTDKNPGKPVEGAALEMALKPRSTVELFTDAVESLRDAADTLGELQKRHKAAEDYVHGPVTGVGSYSVTVQVQGSAAPQEAAKFPPVVCVGREVQSSDTEATIKATITDALKAELEAPTAPAKDAHTIGIIHPNVGLMKITVEFLLDMPRQNGFCARPAEGMIVHPTLGPLYVAVGQIGMVAKAAAPSVGSYAPQDAPAAPRSAPSSCPGGGGAHASMCASERLRRALLHARALGSGEGLPPQAKAVLEALRREFDALAARAGVA